MTLALLDGAGAAPAPAPTLSVTAVLGQALPLAKGVARLAGDLGKVVVGTAELAPGPRDRRFADPAWSENPLFRRLAQGYVAVGDSLARAVDALEENGVDWRDLERARFAATLATSALSPTNSLINPVVLKTAFDTGGASLLRGLANALGDLRHNGGLPAQTDRTAFTVGQELAVTPGVVVHRDEVAEIIAYTPTTPQVHARPLVVVPPPIGRYYFLDLRPGRSFVEHAVAQGLQVFLISWRNPGKEQADWDLDTYCARILSAIDVVTDLTGSPDVNTLGFCAGGILQTAVLNHLAATGETGRIASASYGVTLLDFDVPAPLGAFSFAQLLKLAGEGSHRSGVLKASTLATLFAFMRPDDLVFNYVVDGWLLGKRPPVFDILAWSVDGTNLPAGLHQQFLDLFENNTLVRSSALKVLGSALDLSKVSLPTFVTGALNDHLTPWAGCYRTTQLIDGDSTFVLSNSGHIASLVNPPGNPKASYYVGGQDGADAATWQATATKKTGSWWTEWAGWVLERSGDLQDAVDPAARFPVLEAAPGSYVVDRVPAAR
ncbi:MAG: Polyhydroxyalkanoate synthase [Frankiales bacterium]|nr:Polyhydroxyalkanoate synthase [Frankiales bacterium]